MEEIKQKRIYTTFWMVAKWQLSLVLAIDYTIENFELIIQQENKTNFQAISVIIINTSQAMSVKLFFVFCFPCGVFLHFLRTPCKINPAVNTVLSSRKPCREETPLKRLQEHHQQQKQAESGKVQEQSMYCKELLLSGATEFCFEELHAERYFKRVAQEVRGQQDGASASASNWCILKDKLSL